MLVIRVKKGDRVLIGDALLYFNQPNTLSIEADRSILVTRIRPGAEVKHPSERQVGYAD